MTDDIGGAGLGCEEGDKKKTRSTRQSDQFRDGFNKLV